MDVWKLLTRYKRKIDNMKDAILSILQDSGFRIRVGFTRIWIRPLIKKNLIRIRPSRKKLDSSSEKKLESTLEKTRNLPSKKLGSWSYLIFTFKIYIMYILFSIDMKVVLIDIWSTLSKNPSRKLYFRLILNLILIRPSFENRIQPHFKNRIQPKQPSESGSEILIITLVIHT